MGKIVFDSSSPMGNAVLLMAIGGVAGALFYGWRGGLLGLVAGNVAYRIYVGASNALQTPQVAAPINHNTEL